MGFHRVWRVTASIPAVVYVVFAFMAGLEGDRLFLFLNSMCCAIYVYLAAKSHSRVKEHARRQMEG